MSKNEVLSLCTKLRPPLFIYETSAIDQSLQQVKTRSKLALEDLQYLIKQATAENNLSHKIDDETIQEVITSCEILIGVDLWINLDLNDPANEVIELLAMLEPMRFPTAKRMIETFIPKILEKSIKPIFLKYSKIRSDKLDGRSSKKLLLDHDNMNEPWRGEVAQASSLLYCCVLHMKSSEIETMLGLIVPPMLSLVDDYDIRLKTRGVSILDYLLKEAKPEVIQRSGLGDVFYEALVNCLSYQNETSYVPFLRLSFSTIITLVSSVEPMAEKSKHSKYEKILSNSVVRGFVYSGDKIAVRQVLLEQVPRLAEKLGIVTVKYLQDLIHNLCATLEIALNVPNKTQILNLHLTAAKGIELLVIKCWPRIPQYAGKILKSIATSWCNVIRLEQKDFDLLDEICKENITSLKAKLRKLCQLLKLACVDHSVIENDIKALIDLDCQMFELLFVNSL